MACDWFYSLHQLWECWSRHKAFCGVAEAETPDCAKLHYANSERSTFTMDMEYRGDNVFGMNEMWIEIAESSRFPASSPHRPLSDRHFGN